MNADLPALRRYMDDLEGSAQRLPSVVGEISREKAALLRCAIEEIEQNRGRTVLTKADEMFLVELSGRVEMELGDDEAATRLRVLGGVS